MKKIKTQKFLYYQQETETIYNTKKKKNPADIWEQIC